MIKPKILIVEDETITSHHLRRVLDRLGYDVVGIAANGVSALEQLVKTSPDLLLADIGLDGDVDGIEVAARAREEHGVPTVFLTAYSDAETIRRAKLSEPYGFLVKPFAEQELHATIEIGLQHNALRTAQEEELTANARILVRTREELNAASARLIRAQEQEREEIARDLHDDFGQRLALMQVSLESLWRNLPARFRNTYNAALESILQNVGELAKDLRNVSHRLHPSVLDDLGLTAALRDQAEAFQELYSIPTRVSVRSVPDHVSPQVSLILYRIVQEGLHNIAKHAGEEALVAIALIGGRDKIDLTIRDTGRGFEPREVSTVNGIGLISMQQRAEAVGGRLAIDSVPGRGTRIHVRVPLQPADEAETNARPISRAEHPAVMEGGIP